MFGISYCIDQCYLPKLFFAKEYPTNKTLNTANKILMKNDKTNFFRKNFML
jgi:hypothetical protein